MKRRTRPVRCELARTLIAKLRELVPLEADTSEAQRLYAEKSHGRHGSASGDPRKAQARADLKTYSGMQAATSVAICAHPKPMP